VEAITVHKTDLDELGKISATLADEKAHLEATTPLAAKERVRKVAKAEAQQQVKDAQGLQKAMMRKAKKLAEAAAAAQVMVEKKTVAFKVTQQHLIKATNEQNEADKAFKIHSDYEGKLAKTTVKHTKWQKMALMAEHNVTHAKELAVAAMEDAQCIVKDHRSGCKSKAWKKHCQNAKWKPWMMTHCTESCGFSCSDLHSLAMGVVLKAEDAERKKVQAARKEACPKFNDLTKKNAAEADRYGRWSTQYEQDCHMRKEKKACTLMTKYLKKAKYFEKLHEEFKAKMMKLSCYEYHGQWATGPGAVNGTATGKKYLRLVNSKPTKTHKPVF
jgi:hypothetical protein